MINDSGVSPLPRRPGTRWDRSPPNQYERDGAPSDVNDLAYLVNQVQGRVPPIRRAHARYADEPSGEPTVLVINTDSGELLWRVPLTGLLQLAARFLRSNPQLVIRPARDPIVRENQRAARPSMNDLAYLVNQVRRPQRPVIEARAEFVEREGEEPTVLVVNIATDEVVEAFPLQALLRLAASLRLHSGLVFSAQG
ncbi:MAG: hypothetical protein HY534_02940 [Chloroflexi bacterium]|nr:hypothetical protein [Chloroflexota bacterium]